MANSLSHSIDVFAVFKNRLWISGWVFDAKPIRSLELAAAGIRSRSHVLSSYGKILSADVERLFGPAARRVRFDETVEIDQRSFSANDAVIVVRFLDGTETLVRNLGSPAGQRAATLHNEFRQTLAARASGTLLEVGSRARSAVVRRDFAPAGWDYVGLDVMAGRNVDVVGDAHELSRVFPSRRFDAVMSLSVLEHLLMPWKFVVELNRVLNIGAVGLFTTHQCWPMHDQPWDFWRFSDRAWDSLLNRLTGFEIIEAAMGEPAFVVAQRCHNVTNFGLQQGGFLASNVLFRKIAETGLTWPVGVDDIVSTSYPKGELSKAPV